MDWKERQRALDLHRANLPSFALIQGRFSDEDQECAFELTIQSPPEAGRGIVVPPRKVRAIIDTGCTVGAIRYDLALQLGLTQVDLQEVENTTSGDSTQTWPVFAAKVTIDAIGARLSVVVELVAQDMRDDVLVGLGMLKGGILTVDYVQGIWDWRYVSPKDLPEGSEPPTPFAPH